MKQLLFAAAAVVLLLAGTPAQAFHCPADMAEIDAALAAKPMLSPENMAKVTELRAKGEALHKAGNHQASVDNLAEAKALLGLKGGMMKK